MFDEMHTLTPIISVLKYIGTGIVLVLQVKRCIVENIEEYAYQIIEIFVENYILHFLKLFCFAAYVAVHISIIA